MKLYYLEDHWVSNVLLDEFFFFFSTGHVNIFFFTLKIGGAIAIEIATRINIYTRIWCLIIENTFTSIPDMAAVLIKLKALQYLPIFFYKNKVYIILQNL